MFEVVTYTSGDDSGGEGPALLRVESGAPSRERSTASVGYPNVPNRRLLGPDGDAADIAWHVSPPGRFPLGRNTIGIEIAGDLLHWVSDAEYLFNWTLSWEGHGGNLTDQNLKDAWPGEPNGYYAIGFRCANE